MFLWCWSSYYVGQPTVRRPKNSWLAKEKRIWWCQLAVATLRWTALLPVAHGLFDMHDTAEIWGTSAFALLVSITLADLLLLSKSQATLWTNSEPTRNQRSNLYTTHRLWNVCSWTKYVNGVRKTLANSNFYDNKPALTSLQYPLHKSITVTICRWRSWNSNGHDYFLFSGVFHVHYLTR